MKKIILLALCLAAWMCFVNAQSDTSHHPVRAGWNRAQTGQPWKRPGGRPGQQTGPTHGGFGHMMPRRPMGGMRYSREQLAKLKEIGDQYRQQVLSLEKSDNITLKEYKTRLAGLQKEHREKMQGILTEEQKKHLEEQRKTASINEKVHQAGQLERMKLTLNLTDDQVSRIKNNEAAGRDKMKSLRENGALLPGEKREQMKLMADEQSKNLRSVLNTEQQAKWDSLHKRMGMMRDRFPMQNAR